MSSILKMRPADPDDEPFLRKLRAEVDSERLFLHTWSEEDADEAKKLLDFQFRAHAHHHKTQDVDQKDVIIEIDGVPAGRFILVQDSYEIRLADIEVARDFRGKGIGAAVINAIKGESTQSKRPIRLMVERMNTALQFYLTLGFVVVEHYDLNLLMEWVPPTMPGKTQYHFGGQV